MAKTSSTLEGEAIIPASEVENTVRKAIGLPPNYFVSVGKAKIDSQTGNMTCQFTASTEGAPPPPPET